MADDSTPPPVSPHTSASVASPRCLTVSGNVLRRVHFDSPSLVASLAPPHSSSPSGASLGLLVPSLTSSLPTSRNGRRDAYLLSPSPHQQRQRPPSGPLRLSVAGRSPCPVAPPAQWSVFFSGRLQQWPPQRLPPPSNGSPDGCRGRRRAVPFFSKESPSYPGLPTICWNICPSSGCSYYHSI